MEISLFERLIKNDFQYSQLKKQHRMRPEISRTLMPHFYADLQDDESVSRLDNVRGMKKNIFFINHKALEDGDGDSTTHKNTLEAKWAVELADYFLKV